MQSPQATWFEGVREYRHHSFPPDPPFVLRIIQLKWESDLFIYGLVEEGSESQYEFSEINYFVIIGVENPEEIPCINTIPQIHRLSKFFIVDYTIIFLGFTQLVKEQVEVVDFFWGESWNLRKFH